LKFYFIFCTSIEEASPLGLPVEERAGRVEVHHLLVDQGAVPVVRVLPG